MKVTILTPTYNDGVSIEKTLDSLRNQNYEDWEQIIIDDGSTDNTKEVIEEYSKKYGLDNKIKYIYQENADQLNAILNGINYARGEYVFTLHSDDLLPDNNFLKQATEYMDSNPELDAITGDLIIIDENDNITNRWKALDYKRKEQDVVSLILNGGANIYGDVYFLRRKTYESVIKNNYLMWNTPIWIDFNQKKINMLNIKTVNFPLLKYRIHSNNYAKNKIGKFNLLNGELRTLTKILSEYEVKNYNFQYILFKIFRAPIIRRFNLYKFQKIKYKNCETSNRKKYKIIKNTIKHSYGNSYRDNIYLNSIVNFYKKLNINREIKITSKFKNVYKGKDTKAFATKLYNNELEEEYVKILNEMSEGFNKITVNNKDEKEMVTDICKFLCIYPYVSIEY